MRDLRCLGLLGAAVLLVVAHPLWLAPLGRALVVAGSPRPADVVLPLAGDEERLAYAAELFAAGYAPRYALTNVPLRAPNPERAYIAWARRRAVFYGAAAPRIVEVPGQARTTYQEAQNIRAHAEQAGWGSILVVTSSYHTCRAAQILAAVFHDSPIQVTLVPVPDSWYQAER